MAEKKNRSIKGQLNLEQRLEFLNNKWYLLLIISILCFILYGNTIRNKYSLDDQFVAENNMLVDQGFKALPKIFTSLYVTGQGTRQSYGYRPVVKASFAIEHQFTKGNPHVSHFINVVLYILCCFLLFIVLRKTFPKLSNLFLMTALLFFIFNPVHTEVVASLKNRDELLCFLFAFLSVWLVLKFVEKSNVLYLLLAVLSYLLGYLSKFSVISFIALLPLFALFRDKSAIWKVLLVFALFLIVTIAFRYSLAKALPQGFRPRVFFENPLMFEHNKFNRIPTGMIILLFYLWKLILPHPLISYYGYDMIMIADWNDWQVYFSILLHLTFFVVAVYNFRKRPLISFSILFYFMSIAMYSSIIRPIMGIVAERFLLIPSIAFSLIAAYVIMNFFKLGSIDVKIQKLPPKFVLVILLILIPYGVKTIDRNKDWYDLMTLLEKDVKYAEKSVKLNSLYAGELLDEVLHDIRMQQNYHKVKEKAKTVEKHLLISLELYERDYAVWNNLGSLYYSVYGDYAKSIGYFERALRVNPFNAEQLYYNIGEAYRRLDSFTLAIKALNESIMLNPQFEEPYFSIAEVYLEKGEVDEALLASDRIIQKFSGSDMGYLKKGSVYLAVADTVAAVGQFVQAMKLNPANHEMAFSLRDYFNSIGDAEKASYYENMGNSQLHTQRKSKDR